MTRRLSKRTQRRRAVQERLMAGDMDGLREMAAVDPNLLSGLVALLNERDDLLRWRAIDALGQLCAERAVDEDGLATVVDQVRRQLWAMNDESGNIAWHAAEAIGEILCRVPVLIEEFAIILVQHLNMPIFRAGTLWAIGRVASTDPDLLRGSARFVAGCLADPEPLVRAHAAWALARLGTPAGRGVLRTLQSDAAGVSMYDSESGEMIQTTVGQLAQQALGG